MTRPRSISLAIAAASAIAVWFLGAPGAYAQSQSAAGAALHREYDVAHWAASSPSRAGLSLAGLAIPGLQLRARTDRPAAEGGVRLSFGSGVDTTLVIQIIVSADGAGGRDALLGFLNEAQATMIPLADRQGADVAYGENPRGTESAAALYSNVAIYIRRTRDARAETPSAFQVLAVLRARLGPVAAATNATPASMRLATRAPSAGSPARIVDLGAAFEHVEATVTGGFQLGAPTPAGIHVVAESQSGATVNVWATDGWARVSVGSIVVPR